MSINGHTAVSKIYVACIQSIARKSFKTVDLWNYRQGLYASEVVLIQDIKKSRLLQEKSGKPGVFGARCVP